ncbi:hypothetical protein DPMN_020752 [Dreissena polymorpha]|uniref:Uncharacterized protein n=1 Tax=Dreissena polymorpha TaxID=45954 RepID=A0A9D4NMP8_DREPO|nr:hypothetical protein DPMN_020752 [Dreissena polymorpha]
MHTLGKPELFVNRTIKPVPSPSGLQRVYCIHKIQNVQRRAVCWVKHNYSPYDSVTSMKQELGWQTLQDRRNDT